MNNIIRSLVPFVAISLFGLNTLAQAVKDIDGNMYTTVVIGSKIWMAENLRTSKLNDGTPLQLTEDNAAWTGLKTPGYCFYNNDPENKSDYGALYNWYSVLSGKLCPVGWHVPSDIEWHTMIVALDKNSMSLESNNMESQVVGKKLKEIGTEHWADPNYASNESGFNALPGGCRWGTGPFHDLGNNGYWFTSTPRGSVSFWYRGLGTETGISRGSYTRSQGISVRCIKD